MEKGKRKFKGMIGWGLFLGLAFFLIEPVAQAADTYWSSPSVGNKITVNKGDSVTISMEKYASAKVKVMPGGTKTAHVDLLGTTSQSNTTFELKSSFQIPYGRTTIDTSIYWTRPTSFPANGFPKIKFTCNKKSASFEIKVLVTK